MACPPLNCIPDTMHAVVKVLSNQLQLMMYKRISIMDYFRLVKSAIIPMMCDYKGFSLQSTITHLCNTYICTYIRTYICTYVHTYICTYVYIHTYIHTYVRTYVRTYIHTYICTYVRTYIRTYTRTYILHNHIQYIKPSHKVPLKMI